MPAPAADTSHLVVEQFPTTPLILSANYQSTTSWGYYHSSHSHLRRIIHQTPLASRQQNLRCYGQSRPVLPDQPVSEPMTLLQDRDRCRAAVSTTAGTVEQDPQAANLVVPERPLPRAEFAEHPWNRTTSQFFAQENWLTCRKSSRLISVGDC